MKRKKVTVFGVVALVITLGIIASCLLLFHLKEKALTTGKLYYSDNGRAYCYDCDTGKREAVSIAPYDYIDYYTPLENGYIALGYTSTYDEQNQSERLTVDILYDNGEQTVVLKKTRRSITNFSLFHHYLIYQDAGYQLFLFDIDTSSETLLQADCPYGYGIIDGYLIFTNRAPDNEKQEIFAVNLSEGSIDEIQQIDEGIICRNVQEQFVYRKGEIYYCYDFQQKKADECNPSKLIDEGRYKRYFGSLFLDGSSTCHIYIWQFRIEIPEEEHLMEYEYEDYCEYEFIPNPSAFIVITNGDKRNLIPMSSHSNNVIVTGYENESGVQPIYRTFLYGIYG